MTYRNYTMDELSGILQAEPDQNRFIEAAKAFVTKWCEQKYYSQEELDEAIEEARDEGAIDKRKECREEMVDIIENRITTVITESGYEILINEAKTLG